IAIEPTLPVGVAEYRYRIRLRNGLVGGGERSASERPELENVEEVVGNESHDGMLGRTGEVGVGDRIDVAGGAVRIKPGEHAVVIANVDVQGVRDVVSLRRSRPALV